MGCHGRNGPCVDTERLLEVGKIPSLRSASSTTSLCDFRGGSVYGRGGGKGLNRGRYGCPAEIIKAVRFPEEQSMCAPVGSCLMLLSVSKRQTPAFFGGDESLSRLG